MRKKHYLCNRKRTRNQPKKTNNKEKRFTIQARPQGTPFWIEIKNGLTADEAADTLAEEMHDDAKWDDNYEYQIIQE